MSSRLPSAASASNVARARPIYFRTPAMANTAARIRPISSRRRTAAPCCRLIARRPLRRSLRALPQPPERWQSGRSRRTRNAEYALAYRGFQSRLAMALQLCDGQRRFLRHLHYLPREDGHGYVCERVLEAEQQAETYLLWAAAPADSPAPVLPASRSQPGGL